MSLPVELVGEKPPLELPPRAAFIEDGVENIEGETAASKARRG